MRFILFILLLNCVACTTSAPKTTADPMPPTSPEPKAAGEARFRAQGNEPFWNLTMYPDKMVLTTMNRDLDLTTPLPPVTRPADTRAFSYRAQTEAGDLFVTLTPEPCDDTMAETSYTHVARVSVRKGAATEPVELTGCGGFSTSNPLLGQWKAQMAETKSKGEEKAPMIAFSEDGKVSGYSGCNSFNGTYTLSAEGELAFGPLAMTKRFCGGDNPEQLFVRLTQSKEMRHEVIPTELVFRAGGERMVFER